MKGARESPTKIQAKRPTEVESLFREHNRLLVQLLTARLGSVQAAKDVAQEAYVRLLDLDAGRTVNFQRAYLFKIAQNLATDRLRHQQHVHKHRELSFFDEEDPTADPQRSADAQAEFGFLQQVLAELPGKCRRAFELHRFEGLSFAEVAEAMTLSERMIRLYVSRALAHCQSRLDKRAGSEP